MKKVLSLVLALAMILGSFSFAFANKYPDVKDTAYYGEPVNVLSGLGVIGGYPDGTFGTGKSITRAEMAVMLINCLGIPVSGKTNTKFSDVTSAHWASGFVAYASNLGYIAGFPDGTFKPDAPVTYDQALTMIVASLGYTSEGLTGTWPGNFVNAARGLGILKICKTTGSANATREDVCCFLYKALTAPIGRTNKDGEFVPSTPADTMISRLGASDYAPGGPGTEGDPFVVLGTEDSEVNLKEYVGQQITAYANEDGDIIAIKEVFTTTVENTTYAKLDKAYKNLAAVSGNVAEYFKNGEAVSTNVLNSWSGAHKDDPITVALKVSGKNIKEVHSIQEWVIDASDYAAADVQDEINDDHKLLGVKFDEDEDNEIDMNSFALFGRDALADIAEDDVVYVYADSTPVITRIEVGTETVEGKITAVSSSDEVTIGGKKYGVSVVAKSTVADIKTAMKDKVDCTFYLDYAGDIYEFERSKDETSKGFGVVLAAWTETGKKTKYMVEVYTADGKAVEYEVKDNTIYTALPAPGEVFQYELNSKDVVTAVKAVATLKNVASVKVSKNGIVEGTTDKLTSSTVVFKYSGSDVADAENYGTGTASSLYGNESKTVDLIIDKGAVKAVLIKGGTGSGSEDIAYIVSKGEDTADGAMYTILYQGKVVDKEFEATATPSNFYTLTMNDDGLVTAVTPKYPSANPPADLSGEKTAVSGNIFTDSKDKNYELNENVYVYVYDVSEDEWTAGKPSSMAGRVSKFTAIALFDFDTTPDDVYEIVFVSIP